jgi:hypothetical protein
MQQLHRERNRGRQNRLTCKQERERERQTQKHRQISGMQQKRNNLPGINYCNEQWMSFILIELSMKLADGRQLLAHRISHTCQLVPLFPLYLLLWLENRCAMLKLIDAKCAFTLWDIPWYKGGHTDSLPFTRGVTDLFPKVRPTNLVPCDIPSYIP